MPETPLVLGPLYGLRTWRVVVDDRDGHERLAGPYSGTVWPEGGAWLAARCGRAMAHRSPANGCACGIYAWHPRPSTARRVLSFRGELAGIVETRGAIELHDEGFRAEEARPYALVLWPRRNPALVSRLADAYGAGIVHVDGARELDAWCREHGLGLSPSAVDSLLGPAHVQERRKAQRRQRRSMALSVGASAALLGTPVLWRLADVLL